ncbi:DJ-1/PfpI family protein [Nonomuraea jabiensis]|uniref:DJ-1/PfpI family protein n=1 Tax=Nonomuraea jabiensis TaxID=882448 RepID=UPI0035E466B7
MPWGTICRGPQVPAALGLLRGRTTAAYPPLRTDMEMAGASFVDAPDVVDGAMVSCRGRPDLPEWSRRARRAPRSALLRGEKHRAGHGDTGRLLLLRPGPGRHAARADRLLRTRSLE